MRLGSLNSIILILLFFFKSTLIIAQEKIDLKDLQPTFEEEDISGLEQDEEISRIKSQEKKISKTKI